MKNENYLKDVKAQYENYPYPKRDLEKEKGGMYTSNSENLTRLNHYGFNGDMPLFRAGEMLLPPPSHCYIAYITVYII